MMDKIVKKQINGGEYTFVPLAARSGGLDVYRKLHGYVFPLLGSLSGLVRLNANGELEFKTDGGLETIQALVGLAGKLMADEGFCKLVDQMLTSCAFNGGAISADHWDHRLGDYDFVVAWLVWVNFLRPFLGSVTSLQGLADKLAGTFRSLQTSTLSSPGS
jgi:hypothetical protein